jgi:hypothetical protein
MNKVAVISERTLEHMIDDARLYKTAELIVPGTYHEDEDLEEPFKGDYKVLSKTDVDNAYIHLKIDMSENGHGFILKQSTKENYDTQMQEKEQEIYNAISRQAYSKIVSEDKIIFWKSVGPSYIDYCIEETEEKRIEINKNTFDEMIKQTILEGNSSRIVESKMKIEIIESNGIQGYIAPKEDFDGVGMANISIDYFPHTRNYLFGFIRL